MYIFVHSLMEKSNQNLAIMALTEIWRDAAEAGIKAKLPSVDFSNTTYESRLSDEKKFYLLKEFAQVNPDFLAKLTKGEVELVIKIMNELEMNNALWNFEYRGKGREERAFLKLRAKGLLIKTQCIDIHIVNPLLLRRGSATTVIAATYDLIQKKRGALNSSMVKRLRTPQKTQIELFHQASSD